MSKKKSSSNNRTSKTTSSSKQKHEVKTVKINEDEDWTEKKSKKGILKWGIIILIVIGLVCGIVFLIKGYEKKDNNEGNQQEETPNDNDEPVQPSVPVEPSKPVVKPVKKPTVVKKFEVPNFPDVLELGEEYSIPEVMGYYNEKEVTVVTTFRFKGFDSSEYVNVLEFDVNKLGIYDVTYLVEWPDGTIESVVRSTEIKDTVKPVVNLKIEKDGSEELEIIPAGSKINKDVNVEVIDKSSYTITLNNKEYDGSKIIKEEDSVKLYQIIAKDISGNETIVDFTIDTKAPKLFKVEYTLDEASVDVEKYYVTIFLDEIIHTLPEAWYQNGDDDGNVLRSTYSFAEEEIISIVADDELGNKNDISFKVTPGIVTVDEVTYTPDNTNTTNENVLVTIKVSEEILPVEGWTLSNDKLSLTKLFYDNSTGQITVTDLEGNTAIADYKIDWLIKVEYTPTPEIPEDFEIIVESDEEIDDSQDESIVDNQDDSQNDIIEDINQDNTIVVSVEKLITKDILVTVTGVKPFTITEVDLQNPKWTCDSDRLVCTQLYTHNTVDSENPNGEIWNFVFDDDAIVRTFNVKIEGVTFDTDINNQLIVIGYDTKELTNGNVRVEVKLPTCNIEMEDWEKVEIDDDLTHCIYRKTFEENVATQVDFLDNSNESETTIYRVSIVIENIDKKPVTIVKDIIYNKDIVEEDEVVVSATVTLTFDEEVKEIEGFTMGSDNMSATKTFDVGSEDASVIVEDLAGNETEETIEFEWNDDNDISLIDDLEIIE